MKMDNVRRSFSYELPLTNQIAMVEKLKPISSTLYHVALLNYQAHSSQEIARILQLSIRTVERKLRMIRKLYSDNSFGP